MHVDLAKQPWRFRFSLRSLFVLTTVICLALWLVELKKRGEYQQTESLVVFIIEELRDSPSSDSAEGNFGQAINVVYDDQEFCLSTVETIFLSNRRITSIDPRQAYSQPDSFFMSPPNVWVKRDVDSIMDLIVNTHAQPQKITPPTASPLSPTSPLSPSFTKNVKLETH